MCKSCRDIVKGVSEEKIIVDIELLTEKDEKLESLQAQVSQVRDENIQIKNKMKVLEKKYEEQLLEGNDLKNKNECHQKEIEKK